MNCNIIIRSWVALSQKSTRKKDQSWDSWEKKTSKIYTQIKTYVNKRRDTQCSPFFCCRTFPCTYHFGHFSWPLHHHFLPSLHRSSVHCTAKYIVVFPFKIECVLAHSMEFSYRTFYVILYAVYFQCSFKRHVWTLLFIPCIFIRSGSENETENENENEMYQAISHS